MNRRILQFTMKAAFAVGLSCASLVPVHVRAEGIEETVADRPQSAMVRKLQALNRSLGKPPVDARIDRVWHAVPGLTGYNLDIEQSLHQTGKADDERIHLVWRQVKPAKPLASLPAEPIYRGPSAEKSMALMFNVSWGEEYLPRILDVLKSEHVHATFFLDGDFVRKQPELAKRIAKEGHAIGSHGTGHPDFRKLSTSALERQVVETNASIAHTIGKPVDLLAPPAGSYDDRLVKIAARHHVYTILWTIDTIDWRRPPASAIESRVQQQKTPGGLVLMHPTLQTAQALPKILSELQNNGYHLKTVEDIVHERPFAPPPTVLSGHL